MFYLAIALVIGFFALGVAAHNSIMAEIAKLQNAVTVATVHAKSASSAANSAASSAALTMVAVRNAAAVVSPKPVVAGGTVTQSPAKPAA